MANTSIPSLSLLSPRFLEYARVELQHASQTISKYAECLRQVARILGDRPVGDYTKADILALKGNLLSRGLSVSRQVGLLAAFKGLLQYCRDQCGLLCMDPREIVMPTRPRREVVFLTPAEVARFVESIRIETDEGEVRLSGLRFRALVEVLLGTGMRISEVLSLKRTDVDFASRQARIVGKGGKERLVFFTDRALWWLSEYLHARHDEHPSLFVRLDAREPLKRPDIWRPFARYRKISGIAKAVTPHMLRHTVATQLLFNGCPVGHIKEILGHERLETTCRYYLGLDHRAAKAAHTRFLYYPREDRAG
ncbi:MAG: tyrosine-type recombinase/integrase [Bryobacteraceae bacterium]